MALPRTFIIIIMFDVYVHISDGLAGTGFLGYAGVVVFLVIPHPTEEQQQCKDCQEWLAEFVPRVYCPLTSVYK